MNHVLLRVAKSIAIALLAAIGLVTLVSLLNNARLRPPEKSDFVQDYLMAKATVSGLNPYQPLDVLGEKFGIATQFRHASPHPPSFAIFSLPLALFSFKVAAFIWLMVGLASLLISLRLLFNFKTAKLLIVFLVAVAWLPVWANLYLGQLMLLQLLLLSLGWVLLRSEREVLGGVIIGLTISIKLLTWPLLFFLLFKKRFRAAVAASGIIALTNVTGLLLLGFGPVFTYYFHTGKEVAAIYGNHAFNISVWTVGERLFHGTTTIGEVGFHTDPLIKLPSLSYPASIVCVLAIGIYALFAALKARSFDTSFAILVCASIVLSPVAWISYLTLLIASFAMTRHAADWKTRGAIVMCLIAPYIYQSVVPFFGSSTSFSVGLLTILPMFTVVIMMVVLYSHEDRVQSNVAEAAAAGVGR